MKALLFLSRLKSVGAFRQLWRSFKTPEGAIRSAFTLLFGLVLCLPLAATFFSQSSTPQATEIAIYIVGNVFPFALAFVCIAFSQQSTNSLDFSQSEIDILFTGPFSRSELLVYKLLGILTSSLVVCFAFMILLGAGCHLLPGSFIGNCFQSYIGLVMSFLFLRLVFMIAGLVKKTIMIRFYNTTRKLLGLAFMILLSIGIFSVRDRLNLEFFEEPEKFLALAKGFFDSRAVRIISWPFKMFSNLVLAQTFSQTALWTIVCLSANAILVGIIVKMDSNFLESSVHFAKLKAEIASRQQSVEASFVPGGDMGSLPMLPFLKGAGPIAWRQLQTFYRSGKFLLVGMLAYYGFTIFLMNSNPELSGGSKFRFSIVLSMVVAMSGILPLLLPMGFQNDSDKMEIFKSLPFEKWEIAAGQLFGPMIAITAIQFLTIFIFMFSALDYLGYWFALAMFAPLISLVILCIVNSLALVYPSKRDKGVAREIENIGHILVFVFLLGVVVSSLIGILVAVGGLIYLVTNNVAAVTVGCWLTLLVAAVAGVLATGWAFGRFDVTKVV